MNIFENTNFNETSNNYYNAYKADLKEENIKNNVYSLNSIIKIEFLMIVAVVFLMSYNDLFQEFSIIIEDNFIINASASNISDQKSLTHLSSTMPITIKEENSPDAHLESIIGQI